MMPSLTPLYVEIKRPLVRSRYAYKGREEGGEGDHLQATWGHVICIHTYIHMGGTKCFRSSFDSVPFILPAGLCIYALDEYA